MTLSFFGQQLVSICKNIDILDMNNIEKEKEKENQSLAAA